MNTKFDATKWREQRDFLKKRFQAEKTGDQTLFIDQEKLFKPLIESQKENSKSLQDKLVVSQDILSNTLVPLTRELQKRNDQVDALQNLPFYNIPAGIEDAPQSTPQKGRDIRDIINIDLDAGLNTTDLENLYEMELKKPSEVQMDGNAAEVLNKIKTKNKSLGQFLSGETPAGIKLDKKGADIAAKEREIYKSQLRSLEKYKDSIKKIEGAGKFITKSGEGLTKRKLLKQKLKRGRPKIYPDTIIYNNADDLCIKLNDLVTAKEAGNTGLDNSIISALDELLNKKWITKDEYDKLFKNIFSS